MRDHCKFHNTIASLENNKLSEIIKLFEKQIYGAKIYRNKNFHNAKNLL